jgi:hypothetical protein
VTIGVDNRSRINNITNERNNAARLHVWYMPHPNPAETLRLFEFDSDKHYEFLRSTSTPFPTLGAASDIRLINLNLSAKFLAPLTDHRFPEFMKHRPGGLLALETKDSLKTKCADTKLLVRDVPCGSKPYSEWRSRFIEDRSCRDRCPTTARLAHP